MVVCVRLSFGTMTQSLISSFFGGSCSISRLGIPTFSLVTHPYGERPKRTYPRRDFFLPFQRTESFFRCFLKFFQPPFIFQNLRSHIYKREKFSDLFYSSIFSFSSPSSSSFSSFSFFSSSCEDIGRRPKTF